MSSVKLIWFFDHNELGCIRAVGVFIPGQPPSREDDGYPPEYADTRFYLDTPAEEDVTEVIDAEIEADIELAGTSPLYDTIVGAAEIEYDDLLDDVEWTLDTVYAHD